MRPTEDGSMVLIVELPEIRYIFLTVVGDDVVDEEDGGFNLRTLEAEEDIGVELDPTTVPPGLLLRVGSVMWDNKAVVLSSADVVVAPVDKTGVLAKFGSVVWLVVGTTLFDTLSGVEVLPGNNETCVESGIPSWVRTVITVSWATVVLGADSLARLTPRRSLGKTWGGASRASTMAVLSEFGIAFSAQTIRPMAMQRTKICERMKGHLSGIGR